MYLAKAPLRRTASTPAGISSLRCCAESSGSPDKLPERIGINKNNVTRCWRSSNRLSSAGKAIHKTVHDHHASRRSEAYERCRTYLKVVEVGCRRHQHVFRKRKNRRCRALLPAPGAIRRRIQKAGQKRASALRMRRAEKTGRNLVLRFLPDDNPFAWFAPPTAA